MYILSYILALIAVSSANHGWDVVTKLDEYVRRDDGMFSWRELSSDVGDGYTAWVVNMTSQRWYTEEVSTQPIWWHWMTIACPDQIQHPDGGFLMISGGSNRSPDSPPSPDDLAGVAVGEFANATGMCGGILRIVPNQPLIFKDDPEQRRRSEDSIIGYTWRKFILGEAEPDFLLQFPQTKAGVRGLDTINQLVRQKRPEADPNRFLVAGASKRGWTSWLTAATDRRVVGIAPMVMSILNTTENLHHHFRSLGGWSWAYGSYYRENITQYLTHPRTALMADHIDPFAFRPRLTMPKVVISGSGDEFFLVDDSHYFFNQLPGDKYMMLLENTNHAMFPHYLRIFNGVVGFAKSIFRNIQRPTLTWHRNETVGQGGSITLYTSEAPVEIEGWVATTLDYSPNPQRRDFRQSRLDAEGQPEYQPVEWIAVPVLELGENEFFLYQDYAPQGQWRAFFIQASFSLEGDEDEEFDFTTEVNIIPDTMPFPRCSGTDCWGRML